MKIGKWIVALAVLLLAFALACNSIQIAAVRGGEDEQQSQSDHRRRFHLVYPVMGKWIEGFQKQNNGVQINYQSIGSGGGIQQLKKVLSISAQAMRRWMT